MKRYILLTILLGTSHFLQAQDTLLILQGQVKGSGFEYYFNSNENTRKFFYNSNGHYILPILSDTIQSIHFNLADENICEQYLYMDDLLYYAQKSNSKKLTNDLTFINSCIRADEIPDDKDGHIAGEWEGIDNQSSICKLFIYSNLDFQLEYIHDSIPFRREGWVKVWDNYSLTLESLFIVNEFTQTFENDNTVIKLFLKDGKYVSEKNTFVLSKVE